METGILYAIIAGLFWGTSPVLVKRGLVNSDVSAATLIQQAAILFTLIFFTLLGGSVATGQISTVSMLVFAGALQGIGSVFTLNALLYAPVSVVGPIWNTQPIISFFLARVTLKGIEVVTSRDGIAALVVIGVLVMRWA
jgi:uncharacterized membrane protein